MSAPLSPETSDHALSLLTELQLFARQVVETPPSEVQPQIQYLVDRWFLTPEVAERLVSQLQHQPHGHWQTPVPGITLYWTYRRPTLCWLRVVSPEGSCYQLLGERPTRKLEGE